MMLALLSFAVTYLKKWEMLRTFMCVEEERKISSCPKECHVELSLDKKIQKVLFVGDVHGCQDEMRELLELAKVNESNDILIIFAGDICNKGPKNAETIKFIRHLGDRALAVRGNHEQAVLYWLDKLERKTQELPKKYLWLADLSDEDIMFLKNLPFTISIPSMGVVVVHGGLVPGVKLRDQLPSNMLSMRNYVHEHLSGSKHPDEGLPWASQWSGPQFVIFGHDAIRGFQKYEHAIGLDTGCLYGKKLTGLILDRNQENLLANAHIISVDAHHVYVKP